MKLSIIVPAYDEAGRIAGLLDSIEAGLGGMADDYEVVVVDDGSTDGTPNLVRGARVRLIVHDQNRGKAAAVQTGLAQSEGEYVAVLDADLEYSPLDLLPMLEAVERHPGAAVYGSRYLEPANFRDGWAGKVRLLRGQEITSWLANWTLTVLVAILFQTLLTDTLTGLKLYPGDALRARKLHSVGFEGDHEITSLLLREKIPIREVPIGYQPRSRSDGKKIGPRDGVMAIVTFLKYRFH